VETVLCDEALLTSLCSFLQQESVTDKEHLKNFNNLVIVLVERKAKSLSAPPHPRATAAFAEWIHSEPPVKDQG